MALRGDEVPYTGDISPYGSPHVCDETLAYVAFEDFHAGFKPIKKVCVHSTVVVKVDGDMMSGVVEKIKRKARGKGLFCWITLADGKTKVVSVRKVVAAPAISEFVRNNKTKEWYQVKGLEKSIELLPILISPKKTTTGN